MNEIKHLKKVHTLLNWEDVFQTLITHPSSLSACLQASAGGIWTIAFTFSGSVHAIGWNILGFQFKLLTVKLDTFLLPSA